MITLAIGLNRGMSSSVKKVTAVPLFPALPVRPIRWMYATADWKRERKREREREREREGQKERERKREIDREIEGVRGREEEREGGVIKRCDDEGSVAVVICGIT